MTLKSKEAIALSVNLICAKTFLMVPVFFKRIAESGSLILVLYIFALAFVFMFVYLFAGKIKIPKLLLPLIAVAVILVSSINLFEYSRTVSTLYFKSTPLFVIFLFFAVAMAIGGYSHIGKLNLFFVPIIYITVFIMLFFTFSDGNYYYLFPIMGKGFKTVFGEGFFMLSSLFEASILFFIPDMLEDKKDIKKITAYTLIFSFAIYLIITAACLITVHTDLPENCFSPLFLILRQLKMGTYFQHPDTAFLIIYFISAFLYLSSMLFFVCKIWGKMSKKVLYIPIALLILILALNGEKLMPIALYLNKILWIFPFVIPVFSRRSQK